MHTAYGYSATAASQAPDNKILPRSNGNGTLNVTNIASVVTIITGILAVIIALVGLRFWQRCTQRKAALNGQSTGQSTPQEPAIALTPSRDSIDPHPPVAPNSIPNALQSTPQAQQPAHRDSAAVSHGSTFGVQGLQGGNSAEQMGLPYLGGL